MADPSRRDVLALAAAAVGAKGFTTEKLSLRQGAMAGEPTATSIILQCLSENILNPVSRL
jgi:hypothetical protein